MVDMFLFSSETEKLWLHNIPVERLLGAFIRAVVVPTYDTAYLPKDWMPFECK